MENNYGINQLNFYKDFACFGFGANIWNQTDFPRLTWDKLLFGVTKSVKFIVLGQLIPIAMSFTVREYIKAGISSLDAAGFFLQKGKKKNIKSKCSNACIGALQRSI